MTTNYRTRADELSAAHQHLRRIADALTDLATHANQRGDKTGTTRALDAIEQLTELAQNLARQMRTLRDEINTHTTQKENPQ